MENKKILNATPVDFQDIHFKSTIEKTIYKALIQQGITPLYEGFTYTLSPDLRPQKVPYYTRRKERGVPQTKLCLEMSPIDPITYTPDFTFMLNGIFVIIEVKGFVNDTYPLKRNLFRKYLENDDGPVMYFEVRSKKELLRFQNCLRKKSQLAISAWIKETLLAWSRLLILSFAELRRTGRNKSRSMLT